ncbi:60S ribosomal subunit assembly/export protein [Thelotrema lepadinum]|nr:60S ribosomal subunit assembly/export protein [Thelotrema lepadinum]
MAPRKPAHKTPRPSSSNTSKKSSSKSKPTAKLPPSATKQQKSHRPNTPSSKSSTSTKSTLPQKTKKKPKYTASQLKIAPLNATIPAGVRKPGRGKIRDKVYVDDAASMMAILAVVNAEKEGNIESKMVRARQLEEVRQAREKESERREKERRGVVEGVMGELRRGRKRGKGKKGGGEGEIEGDGDGEGVEEMKGAREGKKRKRVSFA